MQTLRQEYNVSFAYCDQTRTEWLRIPAGFSPRSRISSITPAQGDLVRDDGKGTVVKVSRVSDRFAEGIMWNLVNPYNSAEHACWAVAPFTGFVRADVPALRRYRARDLIQQVLRHRLGNSYRHAYARRRGHCHATSPTQVRCSGISWVIGDIGWVGKASVRVVKRGDWRLRWRYSYRIKEINSYCLVVHHRHCSKVHRVHDADGGKYRP